MNSITANEIQHHLFREIERSKKTIEKFSAKLIEEPAHAFRWAEGAQRAAARIEVFQEISRQMNQNPDIKIEEVQEWIERTAQRLAFDLMERENPHPIDRMVAQTWKEMIREF